MLYLCTQTHIIDLYLNSTLYKKEIKHNKKSIPEKQITVFLKNLISKR